MLDSVFQNIYFLVFFSIVFSLLVSLRIYPVLIYLAHKKKLMDEPVDRSMHVHRTPTLGGIGMFITFSLCIIIMGILTELGQPDLLKLLSILGGTIILLFLGIKDDLLELAPRKKFMGQLFSAALVILGTDTRIESFYGVFGIGELPYLVSIVFTLLAFVFIINAFNLIDGINGLATSVAIIVNTSFGVYFVMNGQYLHLLVSFSLIGVLVGFLRYNVSRVRLMFMGDSGSLFLGFLLAYQAIGFLSINQLPETVFTVSNAPIMALAILVYPILDALRVFSIRIAKGKSPFAADRNHIHHKLLDHGFSHIKATIIIAVCNLFVIQIAFMLSDLYLTFQLYIISVVLPLVCLFPFLLVRRDGKYHFEIPEL